MKKKHSDVFENNSIKVPFVVPNIEPSDKHAIETALKSNLLTDGPISVSYTHLTLPTILLV